MAFWRAYLRGCGSARVGDMPHEPIPFIRRLCAHKTEVEIQEAEDTFRAYLKVVRKIVDYQILKEQEGKGTGDSMVK